MTLTATITNSLVASQADTAPTGDLSTGSPATSRTAVSHGVRLANGTGAGQADIKWDDQRTVTDGATEDLDLNGVLTDAFGASVDAARIKALYLKAADANTTDLTIGADVLNPWATFLNATGTITLRPGASVQLIAGAADATGFAVTAGTGDILQVANGAGADADYDIVIIAASA